jgi:hypothetical protein
VKSRKPSSEQRHQADDGQESILTGTPDHDPESSGSLGIS